MIDIEELKKLAEAQLWTGDWYDAGCGTVHCTYVDQEKFGDYGEVAHPEPSGVSAFIAAANPQAVLALIADIDKLKRQLETSRKVGSKMVSQALDYGVEEGMAGARQESERLQAENAALRAKTAITMGVGDGSGKLFVHGDHDSIKACQAIIDELAALRQELEEARSALETIASQRSGIPGSTAKADCMASVAGLALRNMNAARQRTG